MEIKTARSKFACEEDCKKQLHDCHPDGEDKTICFDELKECMRTCENMDQ